MILAGSRLVEGQLLLQRGGVSRGAREGLLVITIQILLHLVIPSLNLPSSSSLVIVVIVRIIVLVVVVTSHSVSLLALGIGASKIVSVLILVMMLRGRLILA
jgi:hypothetical protein